jgi:hypothetical protein
MSDNIVQNAASAPQRAKTAAGEVETHKLAELIAAEKFLAAKRVSNPLLALRIGSFVPPTANGVYPLK